MTKQKVPVTPEGVMSYPHLFEPYEASGKYEVTLIFPPGADTSELEKIVADAAKAKWPKKLPKGFRSPLRDNVEKDGSPGYVEGGTFAKFKSSSRPKVVGRNPKDGPLDADEIYPGCRGKVSYAAYAYEKGGGVGVTLIMVNVQKTGEGELLAGVRSDPEDDFDPIDDEDVNAALA